MLWTDNKASLPNISYSSLAQFKTLEQSLSKDPELRKRYAERYNKGGFEESPCRYRRVA